MQPKGKPGFIEKILSSSIRCFLGSLNLTLEGHVKREKDGSRSFKVKLVSDAKSERKNETVDSKEIPVKIAE